jgi:outer membrane receptor for ferrienterochelin and colicins
MIRKTPPHAVVNLKLSRKIGSWKVYAGVDNLFDTIQDERRLDDAAYIYAPIYGRMCYAGLSLDLF